MTIVLYQKMNLESDHLFTQFEPSEEDWHHNKRYIQNTFGENVIYQSIFIMNACEVCPVRIDKDCINLCPRKAMRIVNKEGI